MVVGPASIESGASKAYSRALSRTIGGCGDSNVATASRRGMGVTTRATINEVTPGHRGVIAPDVIIML
jgi:hypothetical protein